MQRTSNNYQECATVFEVIDGAWVPNPVFQYQRESGDRDSMTESLATWVQSAYEDNGGRE